MVASKVGRQARVIDFLYSLASPRVLTSSGSSRKNLNLLRDDPESPLLHTSHSRCMGVDSLQRYPADRLPAGRASRAASPGGCYPRRWALVAAWRAGGAGRSILILQGAESLARQFRDLAVAESVDEQSVVVASDLRVAHAEVHHLLDELLLIVTDRLDDLILGLEADDGRVGVLVRDTVHLGGRPTEVVQHRRHLLGLGEIGPVEVLDVGRELGDDEADLIHLGVAEPRVGVSLQRPLRDRRTVPVVLEVALDALVVHDPAGCCDVALLHRKYHVVLQRLGRALHQDIVGGKPGRADAKALATDYVLHLVGQAPEALRLGDRLQVS